MVLGLDESFQIKVHIRHRGAQHRHNPTWRFSPLPNIVVETLSVAPCAGGAITGGGFQNLRFENGPSQERRHSKGKCLRQPAALNIREMQSLQPYGKTQLFASPLAAWLAGSRSPLLVFPTANSGHQDVLRGLRQLPNDPPTLHRASR